MSSSFFAGPDQTDSKGWSGRGDGFCLVYKRIEAGRLRWPRTQQEAVQISQAEFQRLLDGMTILERSAVKKVDCTQVF
ncbi:MAG: IS66 family insertion sequence element accessory protein TnpB [Enterocloster clostridioformis]